MLTLVLIVILAALVFEFVNGFHDTANSIATVVATKVLAPGWAVIMAAVMNLIGALTGTAVAATIAKGIINTDVVAASSQVILCALLGGIVWNLITWWKGLPSSSSHALIGGLCGAALAAAHDNWAALIWSESVGNWATNKGLLWKVFLPMISSPIAGFALGVLMMLPLWALIAAMAKAGGPLARLARPRWVNAFFGKAQIFSAAYMGYAHGHNDAQKTMGVIALTLFGAEAAGALDNLPSWLQFLHPGSGNEKDIALRIVAELVSAAKPWIGCNLTILWPSVFMIFQPPDAVPAAITIAQVSTIHSAMSLPSLLAGCRNASQAGRLSKAPVASAPSSVRAMMPMVFCASLWPCA